MMTDRDMNKTFLKSAIILCGGKSTRAGMDKQTLYVHHTLITLYIAGKLENVFDEIILVTNKPWLYAATKYKIVEDIFKDTGPLGGIHSGLVHASSDAVYVTACDMPNVNISYIRWMKDIMETEVKFCDVLAVKRHNGMIEPFNAFYTKRTVPVITQMLSGGIHKVAAAHNELRTHYISEADVKPFGVFDDLFYNMNSHHQITDYLLKASSG